MEVWFKVTDRDHGLYPHAHSAQSSKTSKLREWPWDSDHCLNSGFPNNYLQLNHTQLWFPHPSFGEDDAIESSH